MIKNYDIVINFSKNKVISPKLIFVKDDNLSTQLSFTFEDEIPDGQNVKLSFKNANNIIYEQVLTVTNKSSLYLVPNTLLSVNGYAMMSFTYINGEEIYTNSCNITPIDIRNNLGQGTDPTPEEIAIINSLIGQFNSYIANENTRQSQEQLRQTNSGIAIENCEVAATNANTVATEILQDKESGLFKGDQGIQGLQGIKGDAFNIKMTFASIAIMQANAGTGLSIGDFVLISTNNLEDSDNAKLYVWTGTQFNFLTDLSGAEGIQGEQGQQGIQGIQGIAGVVTTENVLSLAGYNALVTKVPTTFYYWPIE